MFRGYWYDKGSYTTLQYTSHCCLCSLFIGRYANLCIQSVARFTLMEPIWTPRWGFVDQEITAQTLVTWIYIKPSAFRTAAADPGWDPLECMCPIETIINSIWTICLVSLSFIDQSRSSFLRDLQKLGLGVHWNNISCALDLALCYAFVPHFGK